MTPNEELHQKFFNEETALVINLSDVELEEHIQELEMIAREAKARIIAAGEERKNRRGKSKAKGEWQVAPSGPDVTVTDAINKVKQRGTRITKLDKMKDKLSALGLSDNEIDQMIAKMVSQARKDKPEANPVNTGIVTDEEREATKARKDALAQQEKEERKAAIEKAKADALIQSIEAIDTENKVFDVSKIKFT